MAEAIDLTGDEAPGDLQHLEKQLIDVEEELQEVCRSWTRPYDNSPNVSRLLNMPDNCYHQKHPCLMGTLLSLLFLHTNLLPGRRDPSSTA